MSRRAFVPLLVAAFAEVVQSACYDSAGNFSKELWSYCQQVHKGAVVADVYYTVTDGFLQIGVHAKTVKGWSGLGFGGNGGMKGMQSVIVRQNVSNEEWVAEERFSSWYETPPKNPTQMVKLMYARQDSAGVTWAVLLPTATCDAGAAQRYVIENLTRWMQFASGETHDFYYHGEFARTQFVVNLHTAPPPEFDGGDLPIMNVTKGGINIPNITNPYICIYFNVTQLTTSDMLLPGETSPIVGAFDVHLHGPSSQYVHHIVAFNCDARPSEQPTHHFEEDHCEGMPRKCGQIDSVWAWAKGAQTVDLMSKDVGLQLTRPWLVTQIHYYNPAKVPGVEDASGGYFYITKTKPTNLAGMMVFNSGALPAQFNQPVPKETEEYRSEVMYVGNDCLKTMFPKFDDAGKINLISMAHHMHTVGTRQEIMIYRDGVNLGPVRDEKAYDFNFQSYEETRIKTMDPAKDSITVSCLFNTLKQPTNYRNESVTFGEQTTAEMCAGTMLYWPKQDGPTSMLWFADKKNPSVPEGKNGVYGCGGQAYDAESMQANPTDPTKWEYAEIKHDSVAWETNTPMCNPLGDLTSSTATDLIAKLMQSSSAVGGDDDDDDNGVLSSGLNSLSLLFILVASTSDL